MKNGILLGTCYAFIIAGSVQHLIGGALLLINPDVALVTWTNGLWFLFNATFGNGIILALTLIGVSLLALLGIFRARFWADVLVLPQYLFYLVGTVGISIAVLGGTYPDGYIPLRGNSPGLFILQDQLPSIVMALGHTIAVAPLVIGLVFGIGPWRKELDND